MALELPVTLKRKEWRHTGTKGLLGSGPQFQAPEMASAFWTIIFEIFLLPCHKAHGGDNRQTLDISCGKQEV